MTNERLLRTRISESGYKMSFIASKVGITYAGLLKKINNETEFKASEIQSLCELLEIDNNLREEIFFAHDVD
jgi:hypothetical protein